MTLDSTVPSLSSTSKFGPGSDINFSHPSQVLCTISSTQFIALNIYPIFRPQFLVLTLDSYCLQSEALDLEDFEASLKFLEESGAERYNLMYNCAEESGCSRNHKHVQIVPKPKFSDQGGGFRFFPDIKGWEDTVEVPYMYFLKYLEKGKELRGGEIWSIYRELLMGCRKTLGIQEDDDETVCQHNMILTKDWIMVIPRRTGKYGGLMVNAMGMMGMPTIANEELFEIFKKIGPGKVLSEMGVPRKVLIT